MGADRRVADREDEGVEEDEKAEAVGEADIGTALRCAPARLPDCRGRAADETGADDGVGEKLGGTESSKDERAFVD